MDLASFRLSSQLSRGSIVAAMGGNMMDFTHHITIYSSAGRFLKVVLQRLQTSSKSKRRETGSRKRLDKVMFGRRAGEQGDIEDRSVTNFVRCQDCGLLFFHIRIFCSSNGTGAREREENPCAQTRATDETGLVKFSSGDHWGRKLQ